MKTKIILNVVFLLLHCLCHAQQSHTFIFGGEQLNNNNRFMRYSSFSGYNAKLAKNGVIGSERDTIAGTDRFFIYNVSLQDLLSRGVFDNDKVILEVKNPSVYRYLDEYGSEESWLRNNGYCYELTLPIGTLNVDVINNDLAAIFGVSVKKEKRDINVLVLRRSSLKDKLKSSGNKPLSDRKNGRYINISLAEFNQVVYGKWKIPVIDETDYYNNIDIKVNIDLLSDIKSLNKELHAYDLVLTKEVRNLEVLVINEIDKK